MPMMTSVSAPGKVMVVGAYLVVEPPHEALVLAASARFYASVSLIDPSDVTGGDIGSHVPSQPEDRSEIHKHVESEDFAGRIRVHLVSPQMRTADSFDVLVPSCEVVHQDAQTQRNPYAEQAIALAVAAAVGRLKDEGSQCSLCGGGSESARNSNGCPAPGASCSSCILRRSMAMGIKVVIAGDNDFYSHRHTLASQSLPLTSASLAQIPRFAPVVANTPASSSDHRPDVAKTGLGSSAAMTTAVVGAVLHFLRVVDLPASDSDPQPDIGVSNSASASSASPIPSSSSTPPPSSPSSLPSPSTPSLSLVHQVAQLAHCLAQGKAGSGFDVATAVFGCCLYRRFSPALLKPFLDSPPDGSSESDAPSLLRRLLQQPWDHAARPVRLPPGVVLMVGEPGTGGTATPSMLSAVLRWRKQHTEQADTLWRELRRSNGSVADALQALLRLAEEAPREYRQAVAELEGSVVGEVGPSEGDAKRLFADVRGAFLRVRMHLREMGEAAGVPVEPPAQTALLDATMAVPGVVLAGVPGAGGYDGVFALVLGGKACLLVEQCWAERGTLALTVRESAQGLRRHPFMPLDG